jgi:DNA-binding transcriptional ArsR family regulator
MEAVLRALSDERRRAILRLIATEERAAGEIAGQFEVSRPAVSQHLAVLKSAGLVEERREGTRRLYRAVPSALDELREYLDTFWGDSLANLKAEVELEKRRRATITAVPAERKPPSPSSWSTTEEKDA